MGVSNATPPATAAATTESQLQCRCEAGGEERFDPVAALYSVYAHAYVSDPERLANAPRGFAPVPLPCAAACLRDARGREGIVFRRLAYVNLFGAIEDAGANDSRTSLLLRALQVLVSKQPPRWDATLNALTTENPTILSADEVSAGGRAMRKRLAKEALVLFSSLTDADGWEDDCTNEWGPTHVCQNADGLMKVSFGEVYIDGGLAAARQVIDPLNWSLSGLFKTHVTDTDLAACASSVSSAAAANPPVAGTEWKGLLYENFSATGSAKFSYHAENILGIETKASDKVHVVDYDLCRNLVSSANTAVSSGAITEDCGCLSAEDAGANQVRIDVVKYLDYSKSAGRVYGCVSAKVMGEVLAAWTCRASNTEPPSFLPKHQHLDSCREYMDDDMPPGCVLLEPGPSWTPFSCDPNGLDECQPGD